MSDPIILSTWQFGEKAADAGWPHVSGPAGSSLEAVEHACRAVEADPEVTSVGYGGRPDSSGQVSLDAAVMLSPARCGAVCYVRRFMHPTSIARLVMEKSPHVMLAGEGAERFARQHGIEPAELLTEKARLGWQEWQQQHDTIGVLAMDAAGRLAAACSTSGLAYKLPGRVGDSPIIGHGLYVDPLHGAAVATGTGELLMGVCGTFLAVEMMRRGASPRHALAEVLERIVGSYELGPKQQAALIALRPDGQWSSAAVRPGFRVAVRTADRRELLDPEEVMLP